MKTLFTLFLLPLCWITPATLQSDETTLSPAATEEMSLNWYTSLKKGQEMAKSSHLPLYICFTGKNWCFWCQKLEKEIHTSPEFIQKVQDKFIFVQIDIPKEQTSVDPEIRELMIKYQVYGVPVILIMTPEMEKLGQLSYQRISPQAFAKLALTLGYPAAETSTAPSTP